MNRLFNSVQVQKPKKNAFDLSYEKKLSCNMGELVPIMVQEVVPGDKFRVNTEMLMRFAPMLAPPMHRVNAFIHYFFVPNRLVYDEWQNYITGGEDGNAAPGFPTFQISEATKASFGAGSLADYMGIPIPPEGTIVTPVNINALPFRAYHLIYNEYYRDQNLSTKVPITKNTTVTGDELAAIFSMRKRAWEKDYFTSAMPWTQKGTAVSLPNTINYKSGTTVHKSNGTDPATGTLLVASPHNLVDSGGSATVKVENLDGIDITINNLRRATKLQQWLERNALGGSRYIESILAHFGVRSSDARLQRPEYLGGGKVPVVVSEVLSTVKETTNPQGNMAGHAVGVGTTNGFKKYFEEHGYIIGLLSVLPKTAYQNGIPRMYSKADRYDWYWPEFAHIGEQAILKKELFFDINGPNDDPFGYAPRYSEYKFNQSSVHGEFRTSLNFWHLGRIFTSCPGLNSSFVESDPTERIFAVVGTTTDHLYVQLYHDVKAIRPMPVFGTPML